MTALSVDEALAPARLPRRRPGPLGQPQRAPPAGRHGADDHHAQGDRPGRRRPGARGHHDRRRPPATCSPSRASRSSETDRTSLYPEQALLEPHAPAGLPRAGQRDRRSTAEIAVRAGRDPRPERLRGRRDGHRARAPTASRSPRYRVTVVDGVETAREALSTTGHPRAGRRAGHGRHQGPPGQQPHGRRPELGRARRSASPVAGRTPSARNGHYRGLYQFSVADVAVGGRRRRPAAASAGRADLPRAAALQQRRCRPVAALRSGSSADRTPLSTTTEQPDGLLGPAAIRELAQQLDLRPTKTLGQNFLHDANTIRRIVRTADLRPDDVVLEVGPGPRARSPSGCCRPWRTSSPSRSTRGWPTCCRPPSPRAPRPGRPARPSSRPTRCASSELPGPPPTALVANLPYNVAVPVLLHLLELLPTLDRALVLVQAEVAERLAAPPGASAYGVPSVKAAWYGEVRRAGARRPEGLLARARTSTPAWSPWSAGRRPRGTGGPPSPSSTPPSPPGARGCAPRSPAGRAARPRPRRGCARPGIDPADPRRAALGHRLRPAGRDRPGASRDVAGARDDRRRGRRAGAGEGQRAPRRRAAAAGRLPRAAHRLPRRLAVRHGHRAAGGGARARRHRRGRPAGRSSSHRPPQPRLAGGGAARRSTRACPRTPTIDVAKAIPAAAGLAGGSADAAAALVALDALWGTRASRDDLAALAAQLGSDVPVQPARRGRARLRPRRAALTGAGPHAAGTGCSASRGRACPRPPSTRELDRLRADGRVPDGTELAPAEPVHRRAPQRPAGRAGRGARQRPAGTRARAAPGAAAGAAARRPTRAPPAALVSGSGPTVAALAEDEQAARPAGGRAGRRRGLPHGARRARARCRARDWSADVRPRRRAAVRRRPGAGRGSRWARPL